ncbi:hypothetical protein GUJ93_ZPchr0002g24107 [Zizania palustris]|uniref:Remorin C-terminal domain-containing protein n=1 Tax=Zizania palustris TaxID=103762 RepID=A0A8J5SNU3_ZIZPA|nr:hypothetical protein GUJ93_ZPchr0002g24107 [Zizania palustris]
MGAEAADALKEAEVPAEEATPTAPEAAKDDVAEEKAIIPAPAPPPASKSEDTEPPSDDSKAVVVFVEKVSDKPRAEEAAPRSSNDRDIALEKVETNHRNLLIKAWLDNEKAQAENKASKKLKAILSWENTKKAVIKTQLKKKEEELERKKAEYAEDTKNKEAIIHKEAEEKRATVLARRGEDMIKAEEMAAKYRATGVAPKKHLSSPRESVINTLREAWADAPHVRMEREASSPPAGAA